MIKQLLFALAFVSFTWISIADNDSDQGETSEEVLPFVRMFDSLYSRRAHIVSEVVSDESGYQTIEEYLNLDSGKQAIITTKSSGQSVMLVDSFAGYIYKYQRFTCKVVMAPDTTIPGLDGFNTITRVIRAEESDVQPVEEMVYLYGVAALWVWAEDKPKSYSKGDMVYDAKKEIFRPAHTWTVRDESRKLLIHLKFLDLTTNKKSDDPRKKKTSVVDSMISSIQIVSEESKRVVRTINILSVEYVISREAEDNVLQVPVGYGCQVPGAAPILKPTPKPDGGGTPEKHSWIGDSPSKFELEVTATKFEYSDAPESSGDFIGSSTSRSSDTIGVSLAYGSLPEYKSYVQLLRSRNSKQDIKVVTNQMFNTKYVIDLRRGTCDISHIKASIQTPNSGKSNVDPLSLQFSNGLSLKLDFDTMFELFVDEMEFYELKQVHKRRVDESLQYRNYYDTFYERTTSSLFKDRVTRIVRRLVSDTDDFSVTIWVLNNEQTRILESYHINSLEMRTLNSQLDLAKMFDVSEECYLNNEKMKAGKDYAWFEFTYNAMGRFVDEIGQMAPSVKEMVYKMYVTNYLRAPRMELILEDDGFVIRSLNLDIPPLEAIYDMQDATTLVLDPAEESSFSSISPDLKHCADICRLHNCKAMSWCDSQLKCIVSSKTASANSLKPDKACKTYGLPQDQEGLMSQLFEMTLQRSIGVFQAIDFGSIALPKLPEELMYPQSETGIDDKTYQQLTAQYREQVDSFVSQKYGQAATMTLAFTVNGHYFLLMPSKFAIESDPLSEFSLLDDVDSALIGVDTSGDLLPPFHEGLTASKYKINSFDDEQRKKSRIFMGLTYDQCAMACVDAVCASFSFCKHGQECIITNINSTAKAQGKGLVAQNSDCFIAQRDFIGNFHKFANAYRPAGYKATALANSASECAFNCVTGTEFACKAFVFCRNSIAGKPATSNSAEGTCFYFNVDSFVPRYEIKPSSTSSKEDSSTGCDRYTRSALADFTRIESRAVDPKALENLRTTSYEGKALDGCADICANSLSDCTAFQFCLDADAKDVPMQSCTMIQSKPQQRDLEGYKVSEDSAGQVLAVGKFIVPSGNCHLFSLRKDSSEAHLRDLALGVTLEGDSSGDGESNSNGGRGLSLAGGLLLYVSLSLVFTAIGCGVCLLRERNDFVRAKVDRIRIAVGI